MAYNYEYPYTDPNRYNDDWLLNRIKELTEQVNSITDDILARAYAYTDEKVGEFQSQVNAIRRELEDTERRINQSLQETETRVNASLSETTTDLNNQFNSLRQYTLAQLSLMDQKIEALRAEINADIIGVNARTDLAIQQNNEYIIDEVSKGLLDVRVVNFFTGELISVQAMFDYLASLHATDSITYEVMADRDRNYNELAALNMTYIDLVAHGNSLFI